MAIKKSELYSSLWKSCDELRGGMDASQYKDYVLTLLFVKYVSDHTTRQKMNGPDLGGIGFCVRRKIHFQSQTRDALLRKQTHRRSFPALAFVA